MRLFVVLEIFEAFGLLVGFCGVQEVIVLGLGEVVCLGKVDKFLCLLTPINCCSGTFGDKKFSLLKKLGVSSV